MMVLVEVTDDSFTSIISENKVVVLDCWAEWCMPCKAVAPVFSELASEYDGRVAFGKLDVESNRGVPSQHDVVGIPTLLFFKNGMLADRLIGSLPKERIRQKIEALLE